jgi:hypothetical protein
MLFGDLTKGSYDFLRGSELDVYSKSYQNVLFILTLEREKNGQVYAISICFRALYFYFHDFYHILCIYPCSVGLLVDSRRILGKDLIK